MEAREASPDASETTRLMFFGDGCAPGYTPQPDQLNIPPPLVQSNTKHLNSVEWERETERRGGCCPLWTMVEERLGRWPGYRQRLRLEDVYRKTRLLGKGSFGTVHRMIDTRTGVRRAVKSLERPSFVGTRDNMERWRRILTEVEVLSCLDHPNCMGLVDVFGDFNQRLVHIVTEYTDGAMNLDRFAATHSIGERDASEIAYHVLRALQYLHCVKGIVHRDIKPDNILISLRGKHSAPARSRPRNPEAALQAPTAGVAAAVAIAALGARVPRCRHCKVLCVGPKACCGLCGRERRHQEILRGMWSNAAASEGEVVKRAVERGEETHERDCNHFSVKLIDFGVARHIGDDAVAPCPTPVGNNLYLSLETIDNTIAGQRDNCSTESAATDRTLELLPRVDVFSLGVVIYILLCRVHPFRGTPIDDPQTMRGKMLRGLDFPKEAWGQALENPLSAGAKDFLSRMLCLDPEDRPTASEALRHSWILGRARLPDEGNDVSIRPCTCPRDLLFRAPEEVGNVCIEQDGMSEEEPSRSEEQVSRSPSPFHGNDPPAPKRRRVTSVAP
eukprot:Hpha_TRINITY_DN13671_c0_g1::TRINITY_DN13671_c0_g1_i1::g.122523::m.122523